MSIDHLNRARAAWPFLVERAKQYRGAKDPVAFTYGEISKLIGCHHRAAQYFLSEIQNHCGERDLPKLQSLVVNAKTRLPGDGYRHGGADTLEQRRKRVRKEQRKAADHNWPSKAPF